MSKFTEFVNIHISGVRQIPVTNSKTSDMLPVTAKDIAQHALDTVHEADGCIYVIWPEYGKC